MSPREVVHRLGEQAKRRGLRREAGRWDGFDAAPISPRSLSPFAEMVRAKRSEAFENRLKSNVAETLGGGFSALGCVWPQSTAALWRDGAWFVDPVTKKNWPGADTFSFDVEYRHNPDFGDVKYVWEANRLQFLQPVAILAPTDRRLARFAIDTVLQWMDANPPFMGVNWNSGIELALRLVSLAIVVAGAGDALTPEESGRFRQFIAAHGAWLERFPSLYSSANNHRVAEGPGLLTAALLVPDLPESPRRLEEGADVLRTSLTTQFHDDGVGVEQSPAYAAFTLEMLSVGALLLADTSFAFEIAERDKLANAASALRSMLDENGMAPSIGDDDEGRVVGTAMIEEPRYVASVVSLAAAVSGRKDLRVGACDESLRDGFVEAAPATPRTIAHGIAHYPSGGYTVVRDQAGSVPYMLVFDHGPLGFGSIAAHGHADALAVWLHVDGKPVLVDAGTYLYHSGGAWREFFRSTAAHNTLEVSNLNQSLTAGAFNWRHKARATLTRASDDPDWEIEARHDGYKTRLGIEHVRTLKHMPAGMRIEDRLYGGGKAVPVSIRYLVHPRLSVMGENDRLLVHDGSRVLMSFLGPKNMRARNVRGQGDVIGPGWYSP